MVVTELGSFVMPLVQEVVTMLCSSVIPLVPVVVPAFYFAIVSPVVRIVSFIVIRSVLSSHPRMSPVA